MDVGRPSNLERLEDLFGHDRAALAGGLAAHTVSDDEARDAMAWAWTAHGVLIDPHTAVGVAAARRPDVGTGRPVVVLATAHPAKFADAVREATGVDPIPPEGAVDPSASERILRLSGGADALAARIREGFT